MAFTYRFKTKPDPHQVEALKKAIRHRRFGIFFQQRVGKTKVAIDFCGVTTQKDGHNKILIVCPLSVRLEWEAQIKEHLPLETYEIIIPPKEAKKRREIMLRASENTLPTFLILNYDILHSDVEYLKKYCPDTIIFDESHLIGGRTSRRSKASATLGKIAKNVLLLTGTPIPKHWYNIFGQFRAMDNRIFGSNWAKFIAKWGRKGGYMGKEIVACTDMEGLSRTIANHSIRVLREDVFDEPNIEDVVIPVELSRKSRKAYDDLKTQAIIDLSEVSTVTADLAIVRMIRLHQICGGNITDDEGVTTPIGKEKLDVALDLIRTKVEGEEQVVVFYKYVAEGERLYQALTTSYGEDCIGWVCGSIPEKDRTTYKDEFQAGNRKIMLVQIATGAMGITLDKAHINIFYSLDFSLVNFLQAKDRIMGRNQKNDVTNYFLAVKSTIDYKVMKVLKQNGDVASLIADRWRWLLEE